jgi:DNA-binding CsgD family transcriptional regulator
MKTPDEFWQSVQPLSAAATIDELTAQCRTYAASLGFDSFVYALRVPTQFSESRLVMLNGYPDGWVDHYFERSHFVHDPVLAHCAGHNVPVQWQDLITPAGSASRLMMDEAGDFGLRAGVTVPVHSPHGELGILSFAVNHSPRTAREITRRAMPYVQLLSSYLHEAVRRVAGLDGVARSEPLTPRECECLRWAADGKTSGEIAQLLCLAESTVNFHLNKAMHKLQVCNRQHAVARAALQGHIQPRPF